MAGMMGFYPGGNQVSEEDRARIRQRQASHDWYLSGMDKYSGGYNEEAMLGWLNDRTGKNNISPWVNTFGHDRQATWDAIRGDDYNAFLGREGGFQNDKATLGSVNEGYLDDSIAGWFKQQFAGDDMVQHRRAALEALQGWNGQVRNEYGGWDNGAGHGINKATTRMSKKFFDEMGLGDKFGLEWVQPESGASQILNGTAEGGLSKAAQMLQGNGGGGGRAGEMLRGGLMSGGGEAVRDVIYGKAQEKIFGE